MKLGTYQKITALILITSVCLTGCWDMEEITALAPFSSIGIDQGSTPGMLRVSAQISLPGSSMAEAGGGASSNRLRVLTVEAESLVTAFAMMQSRTRRRPFFQHLNYVVFGAELAKEGIGKAIEAMQGWTTIRGSTLLFVAQDTAVQVLHAHSGIGRSPGGDITDIISNVAVVPVARKMTLNDVINALSPPDSTSLTLPILGLTPLALTSGDETPASGIGQGGEQFMEISMGGTALFNRDRWVAELSVRETQTLAALIGEAKEGASAIPNPANEGGVIAPQYEDISVEHKIEQLPGGQLQIIISPQIKVRLVEIHGGYDLATEGFQPIETAIENDVRTRVLNLAEKLQEQGLDSLNIGQLIKRSKPKLWLQIEDDWPQVYAAVEFRSEPKARVRTTGLLKSFNRLGE